MTGRILFISYTNDLIKINGRDGKTYYGQFDIDDHANLEDGTMVAFDAWDDCVIEGEKFTTAVNIRFLHRGLTLV